MPHDLEPHRHFPDHLLGQAGDFAGEPRDDGGFTVVDDEAEAFQKLPQDSAGRPVEHGQLLDEAGLERATRGVLQPEEDLHAAAGPLQRRRAPAVSLAVGAKFGAKNASASGSGGAGKPRAMPACMSRGISNRTNCS